MANRMERFTQRARRVLSLAQEAAQHRGHEIIAPEHVLLALAQEDGGVAGRVLSVMGLDDVKLAAWLTDLDSIPEREGNSQLDLSPDVKKMLELAVDEARRMGHHYIGTEHLLIGLMRREYPSIVALLAENNLTTEQVRQQVRATLQESPAQQATLERSSRFDPQIPIVLRITNTETGEVVSEAQTTLAGLLQSAVLGNGQVFRLEIGSYTVDLSGERPDDEALDEAE